MTTYADDGWRARVPANSKLSTDEYREMITWLLASLRDVQNGVAGAAALPQLAEHLTAEFRNLSALLAQHQVPEADRWDGVLSNLPGRGTPLLPPYVVDEIDDTSYRGRVTFGRYHLGSNGAAHGGTVALFFDDISGRVARQSLPGKSRTAYIKVNYRKVTPIDAELMYEVKRVKVEGRKRLVTGRIWTPDGQTTSDTESLFIALNPGQA